MTLKKYYEIEQYKRFFIKVKTWNLGAFVILYICIHACTSNIKFQQYRLSNILGSLIFLKEFGI